MRDVGAINDFGNENWIILSDWMLTIFSFPIYFFVSDKVDSYGIAFLIYIIDLIIISTIIYLTINGISRLRQGHLWDKTPSR
jgi:large-conductance mechanosensitive channel